MGRAARAKKTVLMGESRPFKGGGMNELLIYKANTMPQSCLPATNKSQFKSKQKVLIKAFDNPKLVGFKVLK